ncbi:DUF935 family protein [Shewanella avicenniae]|uniref:DUF935 family protein n=1 Tax=Shewanella avicenniae TaxID=2814294 RepID=A0ABX7QNK9_9GAMM|nr:DUF935 family protein [Shewanella avicenniae]QSX32475.1 DUF935 family protein [Shewanella avicenniae]
MANKLKPIQTQELSRVDHGKLMAQALINGMIQNPDNLLREHGGRFDVYRDILRDDQVASCYQQRTKALISAPFEVKPASESAQDIEIAEFVTQCLDLIPFDDISEKMIKGGVHYGYSVAEIMWGYSQRLNRIVIDAIKVRDRSRFRFGPNGELYLVDDLLTKQKMPREKFWVFSTGADNDDNPYGEGLAFSLYWPVFFKRNGIKFWMIFLEKFGMPTATARLSQAQMKDNEQVSLALSVLDAIQADSGVVVPEDFAVELIEASRSGTADYNSLKAAMDASIAKIILSQTMTTDNGSSRSQSETHMAVRDEIIKSDADQLCYSFTEQVVKQLVSMNYPNADIPTVWRRTEPEVDLNELADRDNKIAQLGYEPTEEYITETYGAGWRKKTEVLPPNQFEPTASQPVPPMGAEFAEVSRLTDKRVQHRRDMQALADAAEYLSTKYQQLIGTQVDELMAFMETTPDAEKVRAKIQELMDVEPPKEAVDTLRNATFVGRLMGMLKASK